MQKIKKGQSQRKLLMKQSSLKEILKPQVFSSKILMPCDDFMINMIKLNSVEIAMPKLEQKFQLAIPKVDKEL